MKKLYCPDCGEYLMVGSGESKDCLCGWVQPWSNSSSKKKYRVTREYTGYVRGYEVREVEAESEEEAKYNFYDGVQISDEICRDDTHSRYDAEEI